MKKIIAAYFFVFVAIIVGLSSFSFAADKTQQLREIVMRDINIASNNYFELASFTIETEFTSHKNGDEYLKIKYHGAVHCTKTGGWMTIEKDGKITDFRTDSVITYSATTPEGSVKASHNTLTVSGNKYRADGWLEVVLKGATYMLVSNSYTATMLPKEGVAAPKPVITTAPIPVRPPNDDSILQDYFRKNNLQPTKTASGLYYTVEHRKSTPRAINGQVVSVNYTGTLLDGTKFDSNTDSLFRHVKPFTFMLGRGAVIQGWDEGILLLRKNSRAKFFIPSSLAYKDRSPSPKIPPYSCLIFDVELVDIE